MPVPSSRLQRVGQYLGLVPPERGRPQSGKNRPSRYGGMIVGARLDEDIDELRRRVEALERGLGTRLD